MSMESPDEDDEDDVSDEDDVAAKYARADARARRKELRAGGNV